MSNEQLQEAVANAQHDLRNPLGNILGFCEILGQPVKDGPNQELRHGFLAISNQAEQMARDVDRVLDPNKPPPGADAVKALQQQLRKQTADVISAIQKLSEQAAASEDKLLCQDLSRMADSAARLARVIETALTFY